MAIAEASTSRQFYPTLRYVARWRDQDKCPAKLVFANIPEALEADDPVRAIARSMDWVASQSCRVQKPCYHISLSPALSDLAQGKFASTHDWHWLVREFLTVVGLQAHQAVAFLHDDAETDGQRRPHVHIIVNRIHDYEGTAYPTSWDYYHFQAAVRHLERCYDLESVASSWEAQPLRSPAIDGAELEATSMTDIDWDGELYDDTTASMPDLVDEASDSAVGPTRAGRGSRYRSLRHDVSDSGLFSVAQELNRLGHQFQGYEPNEIEGLTLSGVGLTMLGTGLTLAEQFREALSRARERAQSERLRGYLDRLAAIDTRTSHLEETLVQGRPDEAVRSVEATLDKPVMESLVTATGRIDQLEELAGQVPASSAPLSAKINPSAPIEAQLDAVGEVIAHLETRLESLEERVAQLGVAQELSAETVAQRLSDYVKARAAVYHISPDEPVVTKTLGTIALRTTESGQVIQVGDECYGIKFAARQVDETWQVTVDDLSAPEKVAIARLPSTAADYLEQANGKEVVRALQVLAPREFGTEGGQVRWQSEREDFAYQIDIASVAGHQRVMAIDIETSLPVLSATIESGGAIRVERCTIPSAQVDALVYESQRVQEQRERWQQRVQRGPQQERPEL